MSLFSSDSKLSDPFENRMGYFQRNLSARLEYNAIP